MEDDFSRMLADRFRARAASDYSRLLEALQANDLDKVLALSHSLSGTAGTLGFPEISKHAEDLERAVGAGQTDVWQIAYPLIEALRDLQ
ncbi:Hpt domain-containing protein [Sphingomonas sp. LY29]|uniref:Hpt domain-containing protein n=1 Tax=Sphingomonas sp. LY29 TaxID=3095341 RepID=UPI002D795258|nr:Hpt domain-containing protein [Sphingomonas sp. LY29]WRP26332.1 Hpt domain-containing protein [Sphingomonas sp. LY29]